MRQLGTVAWLAVRELWITFRLLLLLTAFVGPGVLVALLPAPPAVSLARLGLGLGIASGLAACVAAWSVADERRHGRTGWLVARSVARGTYLAGWFAALAGVALLGVAAAGVLGWLAVAGVPVGVDPATLALALSAVAGTCVAAIALGMLAGAVLPGLAAAGLVAAVCVAAGVTVWLAAGRMALLPGAAFSLLGRVAAPDADPSAALSAAGTGLSLAAVLLVAARVALEQAEL